MLKIKLPKLFKKKEISPLEKELKKYPKKKKARLKFLLEEYEKGNVLKIQEKKNANK